MTEEAKPEGERENEQATYQCSLVIQETAA
jgi:hypothetical protein